MLNTLEDRSAMMVFVGYERGTKAYRCLNPLNFKVIISRDVIFEESNSWDFSQPRGQRFDLTTSSTINLVNHSEVSTENQDSLITSTVPTEEYSVQDQSSDEDRAERFRSVQDIYDDTQEIEEDEACFLTREEPTSFKSAMKEELWRRAMEVEREAIEKNSTWELVKLLEKCKTIEVKWIYKIKRDNYGEIVRYKARLVAKSFSQVRGVDFEEVFSPVARAESIRIIVAMAAQFKWKLHHLDVKLAFLNGYIEEDIYVNQPEGFIKRGKENYVLKLRKAMYGLGQAPRAWNSKLDETLKSMGFIRSINDQAVYTSNREESKLWVGVYVDDLIITRSNPEEIDSFKISMKTKFEMTDFGLLHSYLGIQVMQEEDGIKMCQTWYAIKILDMFNMSDCNASKMRMGCRLKLDRNGEGLEVESTYFRRIIGCLRYLTLTRPDLVYSVSYFSRFMSKPYSNHMTSAKSILRYVKGTTNFGLKYKSDEESDLIGYCDSVYAGELDDRKSTSGLIFFLETNPIVWNCSKQKVIALLSCEAEYISSTMVVCQGIWISRFMHELRGSKEKCFDLCIDNKSAIEISRNLVHHGRPKHIDVGFHFIRKCVEEGKVFLRYIRTEEQVADFFTKSLRISKFCEFRTKIGIGNVQRCSDQGRD